MQRDFGVEAVYVFGSFARGEEHGGSDIDLLVAGDLPSGALNRVGEVLRRLLPDAAGTPALLPHHTAHTAALFATHTLTAIEAP